MACPHQATIIVAGNGNKVAVFGCRFWQLLPFSATLLPGVDKPLSVR